MKTSLQFINYIHYSCCTEQYIMLQLSPNFTWPVRTRKRVFNAHAA